MLINQDRFAEIRKKYEKKTIHMTLMNQDGS